jgi:hypothetical protein
MAPELRTLAVADPAARWEALGFAVRDGAVALGGVALQLGVPGEGIVGWAVSGADGAIDGLAVCELIGAPAPSVHPNGAIALDHLVVLTPDFDRTAAALASAGMPLRRTVDGPRGQMGFRRLGPAILELVARGDVPAGPARFWGLVAVTRELATLGDAIGPVRDAVQPGRRIAPVRASAGLSIALAFITPEG